MRRMDDLFLFCFFFFSFIPHNIRVESGEGENPELEKKFTRPTTRAIASTQSDRGNTSNGEHIMATVDEKTRSALLQQP